MTFHITIIGIDGSGKSTLTPLLANLLSAELGLTTLAVGEDAWGHTPQETLFQPGFKPDGELLTARLGRLFRHASKAVTTQRRLYPPLRLLQFALQTLTAQRLTRQYRPNVLLSDGNLLLSAAGRAINYAVQPDSADAAMPQQPLAMIERLYAYVSGRLSSAESLPDIAGLNLMRWLYRIDQRFNLNLMQFPDALIFLDSAPETALARLQAKSIDLDGHENLADLRQARRMYRGVVEFFCVHRNPNHALTVDVTDLSLAQTARKIVDFVANLALAPTVRPSPASLLGTTDEALTKSSVVLKKIVSYRYLGRYVLRHLHEGSAHELTFPLSRLGSDFLREGYSAKTMRAIYQQDRRRQGWLNKLFLNYPLHQAIYHRLHILQRHLTEALQQRLTDHSPKQPLKILTAPSGYAFDLFPPLQSLGGDKQAIRVIASDLDPTGDLEGVLKEIAQTSGIRLEFLRGDLTTQAVQALFRHFGPYDMVLFIGLSTWLAKPDLLRHLRLIHEHLLKPGGLLVTDCFTPQAFALSGKYIGYQANYYAPDDFAALLAYCGFKPTTITWESGPEGINHVFLARREMSLALRPSSFVLCTHK